MGNVWMSSFIPKYVTMQKYNALLALILSNCSDRHVFLLPSISVRFIYLSITHWTHIHTHPPVYRSSGRPSDKQEWRKKGRIIFSDDKNWFPISFRMAALSQAAQAIWSTLLRRPGAVDQADSCRNLDECSHWRQTKRSAVWIALSSTQWK